MVIIFIIGLVLDACSEKKYDVENFYKAQGIIISAERTSSPFDSSDMNEIVYEYFVNDSTILTGSEDFSYVDMIKGAPIEVLVHKENENQSFYWRNGLSENITQYQFDYLKSRVEKMVQTVD